jgi:TP901 family phage tail tape measure protein
MGAGFVVRAYDAATPVIKKIGAGFGWLRKQSGRMASGMNQSLGATATGFMALHAGLGMISLAKEAADAAGKFEQNLVAVGKVSGATAHELNNLKDAALNAGLSTKFSPDEAIEGFAALATQGLRASEAIQVLLPSLDLATGSMGKLGVEGAANAVVGSIKAMNFELTEAARVTDQLLKIEQLTNFSTKDFDLVLGRTASAAKMYGQSFEDMLISIGLIRNMNVDAEVASTALREAWRRLASDEGAQQAVTSRGVDIFDKKTGKIRDSLSVMSELIAKTQTLNDKDRMRMITQAFGVRGIAAYNAVANATFTVMKNGEPIILRDMNAINAMRYELSANGEVLNANQEAALKLALGVDDLSRVLNTATGVSKDYRDALLDTYEGQKQLISGAWKTLLIVIGEDFAKAMQPFAKAIFEAIKAVALFVKSMSPEAKQMIFKFVVAIGALVAVGGALMILSGILGMLGGSVIGFVFSIAKLLVIGIPVVMLLSGLGIGFKALAGAFGIAGKNGLSFEEIIKNVRLALSGMMSLLTGEGFSEDLKKEFAKAENQGVVKFLGKFETWLERIRAFWTGLKAGFETGVQMLSESSAFKRLQDKIQGIINIFTGGDAKNSPEVLDEYKKKGEGAGISLTRLGETAAGMLEKLIEFGKEFAVFVANINGEDIKAGIQGFVEAFQTLANVLFIVKSTIEGIYLAIKMIVSAIVETLQFLGKDIANHFGGKFDTTKNFEWTKETAGQMQGLSKEILDRDIQQARDDIEFKQRDRVRVAIGNLEDQKSRITDWMGTSIGDWGAKSKGGTWEGSAAYGQLTPAQQQQWLTELQKINRNLAILQEKSPVITMDAQKVGEVLSKTPAATGEDSLDDAAAVGAF